MRWMIRMNVLKEIWNEDVKYSVNNVGEAIKEL